MLLPWCPDRREAAPSRGRGPQRFVQPYGLRTRVTSRHVHVPCRTVYRASMGSRRLNITLDGERAAKLAQLAKRVHVTEGTLARSLLSTAIDEADPDPVNVVAVLDGIDGALERAELGRQQAASGDTISLDSL